jgi:hypothetical protein
MPHPGRKARVKLGESALASDLQMWSIGIRCVSPVFRASRSGIIIAGHDGNGSEVVGAREGVEGKRTDREGVRART